MPAKEQQSFLIFTDLLSAQTRSGQMATNMKCDGVHTLYWYECTQLTDGRAAMHVDPVGTSPYDRSPGPTALTRLTPAEINALVTWAQVMPFWPSGVPPNAVP